MLYLLFYFLGGISTIALELFLMWWIIFYEKKRKK
jgi:hypothetical protein